MTEKQITKKNADIAIGIISWEGHHLKANQIALSLNSLGHDIYVVHSDSSGLPFHGVGNWINVSNKWFWGNKFQVLIKQAVRYKWLLIIQADVASLDWPSVLNEFKSSIFRNRDLGLWTTTVTYCYLDLPSTRVRKIGNREYAVAATDGLCWGLSRAIIEPMLSMDYANNNYGWGIEHAAAAFCHSMGFLVVLNNSVFLAHPKATGYSKDIARLDQQTFLAQLPPYPRLIAKSIFSLCSKRKKYSTGIKVAIDSSVVLIIVHMNLAKHFIKESSRLLLANNDKSKSFT